MHHEVLALRVRERACDQPLEQRVTIARGEQLIERIGAAAPLRAVRDREQVQVVVAEHHDGVVTEGAHEAQRLERSRATVDEVAHEPQPVAVGEEADRLQQRAQFPVTALHVTDRIARHCRIPGIARRNGSIGASNCAPSSPSIW